MYDTSDLELIKSLISKTKENKIVWVKGYTDWYYISKIPNSTFEIHFKKEIEDFVWVYVLSIENKDKTEKEIKFFSPSKFSSLGNFFDIVRKIEVEDDFNLIESLFKLIKEIVNKDEILQINNLKHLINSL